jgi:hypothetical protein
MCSAARMDSRLRMTRALPSLTHTISFLCALGFCLQLNGACFRELFDLGTAVAELRED